MVLFLWPGWLSVESSGWCLNVLGSKWCMWHGGGVSGFLVNATVEKRWSSGLGWWSKQGRCIKCTGLGLGGETIKVKDLGFHLGF